MDRKVQLPTSKKVSLCVYGPGMTSKEIQSVARSAEKLQASTLFLQELDANRLSKKDYHMPSIGLIVSLPFGGVALDDSIRLLMYAENLGCKAIAFGLPMGLIKDNAFDELEAMIRQLRKSTHKVEIHATLATSTISVQQGMQAATLCLNSGCESVCFGTGTTLDQVQEKTFEALLSKGFSLSSLEVGIGLSTFLDPSISMKWLLDEKVPLRICGSILEIQNFPLQFDDLLLEGVTK